MIREPACSVVFPFFNDHVLDRIQILSLFVLQVHQVINIVPKVVLDLYVIVETFIAVPCFLDAVALPSTNEASVPYLQLLCLCYLVLFPLLHEDDAN